MSKKTQRPPPQWSNDIEIIAGHNWIDTYEANDDIDADDNDDFIWIQIVKSKLRLWKTICTINKISALPPFIRMHLMGNFAENLLKVPSRLSLFCLLEIERSILVSAVLKKLNYFESISCERQILKCVRHI